MVWWKKNTGSKTVCVFFNSVCPGIYCYLSSFNAGLEPFECYAGAVYIVYDDGPGNQTTFAGVTTLESGKCILLIQQHHFWTPGKATFTLKFKCASCLSFAVPAAVPSVKESVEENRVKVTWMEVPRGKRGGCITNYSIYLESDTGLRQARMKTKYLSATWQISLI